MFRQVSTRFLNRITNGSKQRFFSMQNGNISELPELRRQLERNQEELDTLKETVNQLRVTDIFLKSAALTAGLTLFLQEFNQSKPLNPNKNLPESQADTQAPTVPRSNR